MKVTLLTAGSRGDVEPYLALAVGLKRAGHAVRLATHAGFRPFVEAHGIDFAPVAHLSPDTGGKKVWERWQRSGDNVAAYIYYFFRVARSARALLAAMQADFWAACQGAEGIISSTSGFGGPAIAAALGIPHIWALFQPMSQTGVFPFFMSPLVRTTRPNFNRFTYRLAAFVYRRLFRGTVDDWSQQMTGRRLPTGTFFEAGDEPVFYGYSRHVLPRPADWGANRHVCGYWSLPGTPVENDPSLNAFLAAGDRPLYFYLSGIRYPDWDGLLHLVLAAVAETGQRALIYLGTGDETAVTWPESALPVRSVPHDWLFPRVAAVIHHGGAGTTASALRAGVPSVTVPGYWDQPFWSRRIAVLGAGPPPIPVTRLTAERLVTAITAVTGAPHYRARAEAVGRLLRKEDGVATAVATLETYWGRTPARAG